MTIIRDRNYSEDPDFMVKISEDLYYFENHTLCLKCSKSLFEKLNERHYNDSVVFGVDPQIPADIKFVMLIEELSNPNILKSSKNYKVFSDKGLRVPEEKWAIIPGFTKNFKSITKQKSEPLKSFLRSYDSSLNSWL